MFKNKSSVFWVTAGISTTVITLLALKAYSAKKASTRSTKLSSILLIGDSQTAGHFGNAFKTVFSDLKVNTFGKNGANHTHFLQKQDLKSKLQELPCADVIYIQLGDNSVPKDTSTILSFVKLLEDKCPEAVLFWGGPMKAVKPSIPNSNYVTTVDSSSWRYLPTYNKTRRTWSDRLRDTLKHTNVVYIDNYSMQEAQPLSSAFSEARAGDGIHLTADSAEALALIVRDLIESELQNDI